jgi:hypothetical protein
MRNMSFSMTKEQFIDGSKDVTRRVGWWFLKPGDRVMAVEKAMGLQKGEKIKSLGLIEIVSTRAEPLNHITDEDCVREGFPHFSPLDFVQMLCQHYKNVTETTTVNRIEFKRVKP